MTKAQSLKFVALVLLGTASLPSAASACEYDSPTARLPGCSDAQADKRAEQMWSDGQVIGRFERAQALVREAPTIYLGKVTSTRYLGGDAYSTKVTVQPLKPIKGHLPAGEVSLEGWSPNSCGGANGDGDAVYAKPDTLVFVFVGVSKRSDRPRGIDSILVEQTRVLELLDAAEEWLRRQPGYKPYD